MTGSAFLEAWEKNLDEDPPEFENYLSVFEHHFEIDLQAHSFRTLWIKKKVTNYIFRKSFQARKCLENHLVCCLIDIVEQYFVFQ